MHKKLANVSLCVIFAALIVIPLLFADWSGGGISATENRVKAVFPSVRTLPAFYNGTCQTELEEWIADNAAGRETASKINTLAHYYLWHLSARSDTLIGKDDWLFFYNKLILWDYQNVSTLSDEVIRRMVDEIVQMQTTLEAEGIPFLLVGIPDKQTVYEEYFPPSVLKYEFLQPMTERIAEQLSEAGVPCLWLKDALMDAKQTRQVYYARYDTAHWNTWGAFVGYRQIAERLKAMGIDIRDYKAQDFAIADQTVTSLFNGAIPMSETDTGFTFLQQPTVSLDTAWFSQFPDMRFSDAPDAYKRRFLNEDTALPKMVLMGDSYAIGFEKFLSASVSEYTFVHLNDLSSAPEIIEQAKPDIVILECVGRMTRILAENLEALYPEK